MINKILRSILIIIILYLLAVFQAPDFSDKVSSLLWVPNLATNLRNAKEKFDEIITRVPTKEEAIDSYNRVYSWAIKAKDDFEDWVNTTKETIDTFRKTMSWAEEKYEDTKEFIENTSDKINEVKEVIDKVSEIWEENSTWTSE